MEPETRESNPYIASVQNVEVPVRWKGRRPISVWFLMALCLVLAGTASLGIANMLLWVIPHHGEVAEYQSLIFDLGWRLVVVAVSLVVQMGVWRRRKWARWLGMIMVTALTIALVVATNARLAGMNTESSRNFIGHLTIIPLVLACWLYRFGYGKRSNSYFLTPS